MTLESKNPARPPYCVHSKLSLSMKPFCIFPVPGSACGPRNPMMLPSAAKLHGSPGGVVLTVVVALKLMALQRQAQSQ